MSRTPVRLLPLILLAGLGSNAAAQAVPTAARSCERPDTTAEWYRRQREWWSLDARHGWTDDTLRAVLVAAARGLTPASPGSFPLQLGAHATNDTPGTGDSALVDRARGRLREMAQKRSWPLQSQVGPEGVRAAWLIAEGDSALSQTALHRMMEAGPGESSPADVAMLEDQLRLKRGRKQLYASQLVVERDAAGRMLAHPLPTEDLAHVDLRRDAAGLPPLAFALCVAAREGAR